MVGLESQPEHLRRPRQLLVQIRPLGRRKQGNRFEMAAQSEETFTQQILISVQHELPVVAGGDHRPQVWVA